MNTGTRDHRLLLLALAAIVPLFQSLVLAISSPEYSYFIDEFYYIACSKRLAFGYVDHPPLAPLLLAFTRALLGESLFAIRLLAFLAAGATVWLVGRLVQEFGGGRFALALAALAFGLAPGFLGMTGFFSMNAFEPLLWTALMLTLVRLVKTGNSRLWLVAGLLVGLAFENKHTIVAYVVPLALAIVVVRMLDKANLKPASLRDKWLWAGAGIALLLALPNLAWQVANHWPSLEFYRNAQLLKNAPAPPLRSLAAQVLFMNPVTLPVSLAGLAWLLLDRGRYGVRFIALMFVLLLAIHVASKTSRPDRMLAAYPVVFAAGGVAIERALLVRRRVSAGWRSRFARAALLGTITMTSLALAPVVLPVLPPAAAARYFAALGLTNDAERGKSAPIQQLLADRTGWRSFIDDLVRVDRSLSPDDRHRAIVYVPSYGHAGAVELWGPSAGLPRVIASQNTYWHWSVGHTDSDVLIAVGARAKDLRRLYREVRRVETVRCDYCMSWRNGLPIFVARDPIAPVSSLWPQARHYE